MMKLAVCVAISNSDDPQAERDEGHTVSVWGAEKLTGGGAGEREDEGHEGDEVVEERCRSHKSRFGAHHFAQTPAQLRLLAPAPTETAFSAFGQPLGD